MNGMKVETTGQRTGNFAGLARVLVMPSVSRVKLMEDTPMLREGSTGRVVTVLPRLWAVGTSGDDVESAVQNVRDGRLKWEAGSPSSSSPASSPASRPKAELAFYRKYSEGLLRRYLRMSMEAGRVPSLLGREMFRGNVTSYKVHSFEDVVVFCMDVERCLQRLSVEEKDLIRRVALQEYTQAEAAAVLGISLRCVVRQYGAALDRLTRMFLDGRMLEPLKSCQ